MAGLEEKIQSRFKDAIVEVHDQHGDETVVVKREALIEIMRALKEDPEYLFNMLMDLTAVDGLKMNWVPRYEVVYHLYSLSHNHRLRVKVRVDGKDAVVPSVTRLWSIANWMEREVWDMFGIGFDAHPGLKRILMYDGFSGHPLRKDYPYNKRQPLIGPKN